MLSIWFSGSVVAGLILWVFYCALKAQIFRAQIRLRFKELAN